MKKQTDNRHLAALSIMVVMVPVINAGIFSDSFDQPNSTSINNYWQEVCNGNTYGGIPDLSIEDGHLVFDRVGYGLTAYGYVMQTFDEADQVSIEGFVSQDTVYTNDEDVAFRLYVENANNAFQYMTIYVNATTNTLWAKVHLGPSETVAATTSVSHNDTYHKLMYRYEDVGGTYQSRWYLDGTVVWTSTDGGIGNVVKAAPLVEWKPWETPNGLIKADNFTAGKPSTCEEVWDLNRQLPADFDRNCRVDIQDLSILCQAWLFSNDSENSSGGYIIAHSYPEVLFDNSDVTGITVSDLEYDVWRSSSEEIVFVEMFIDSASGGIVMVDFDDVGPVPVEYTAGARTYKWKVPYSTSRNVHIIWTDPTIKWNKLRFLPKTPIFDYWPTSGVPNAIRDVSLAGESSDSCSSVPFGLNATWADGFPQVLNDVNDADGLQSELIEKLHHLGVTGLRYPVGFAAYNYPPTEAAIQVYLDAGMSWFDYHLGIFTRSAGLVPKAFYSFVKMLA